jgi:hypothetical protein
MSNTYKEHLTLNKWNLWAHLPHDTDWSIHSYKFPMVEIEGSKVTSTKGRSRYDCKNELQRTLFFTMYEGEKGTGRVLGVQNYINEKPNWSPIIPESPNMIIYKRLCSKK